MRFEGIYTPLVTPHYDDFSINRKAFGEAIDHLIDCGVHGIVVAGTTGEYYAQSTEGRIELMELARQFGGSRSPSIVGSFFYGTGGLTCHVNPASLS